jgi:hypothetical protein
VQDLHTSKMALAKFVSHINQNGQPFLYDNHEIDIAFPYPPAHINF